MNGVRMGVIVGLITSSMLVAGPKFKDALKESRTEKSSTYITRLQDLATWMFFEAIHWNAANKNNEYAIEWGYAAEAVAAYINSPAIKEIDAELTLRNSAKDKLVLLQDYYTQVYSALAKKGPKALEGSFKTFTPQLPS
jgi:hypothetical protein